MDKYYHYSIKPVNLQDLKDIDSVDFENLKENEFKFIDFDGVKPGGLWLSQGNKWEHKIPKNTYYKYEVTFKKDIEFVEPDPPIKNDEPIFAFSNRTNTTPRIVVIDTDVHVNRLTLKYYILKKPSSPFIKWNHNKVIRPQENNNTDVHSKKSNKKKFDLYEFYKSKHAVSDDYDGIIITNYNKSKENGYGWYSLIDINCACIWRPSKCIEKFTLVTSPTDKARQQTARPQTARPQTTRPQTTRPQQVAQLPIEPSTANSPSVKQQSRRSKKPSQNSEAPTTPPTTQLVAPQKSNRKVINNHKKV